MLMSFRDHTLQLARIEVKYKSGTHRLSDVSVP